MIALGSHHREPLISASGIPHRGDNLEEKACDVSDDDFEVMTMKEEKKVMMMEEKEN